METITVPLWAALQVARWRKRAIPRWKQCRLENKEKDKAQRKAYHWRNRDKNAANGRIRHQVEKEAKLASINAQRRAISKGVT